MKKKILLCAVIALAVMLTAILAACSGNTYQASVEGIDGASISDVGKEGVISAIKEGGSASYDLWLPNKYDPATVKLTVDGQPLSYTLNANYDNAAMLNDYQVALTFTVTNVKKNIVVKVSAEERKADFVFKLAEGASVMNSDILADFRIADKFTALEAVSAVNGKTLSFTSSELDALTSGISITSGKSIGHYELYNSLGDEPGWFIEGEDGYIRPVIDSEKHNYTLLLLTSNLKLNNLVKEVYIYPQNVSYESWYVNSETGSVADCVISGDGNSTFAANDNRTVTITLKNAEGADLSGAKVFVNDTELKKNASGEYVIEAGKSPIEYANVDENTNYITTEFDIRVTGVDMSGATGAKTFTYEPFGDAFEYDVMSNYYYSEGNTAWYYENVNGYYENASFAMDRFNNDSLLPSVITITGESYSKTIDIKEYLPLTPTGYMQAEIYRDEEAGLTVWVHYSENGTDMSDINRISVEVIMSENYTVSFAE